MNYKAIFTFAFLATSSQSVLAAEATPEGVVRKIYASYGIGANNDSTGLSDSSVKQLFEKSLSSLYLKAAKMNAIDADFFVQGQDFSLIKPIEISKVDFNGDTATVFAVLRQSGNKIDKFRFLVTKSADGWRLKDAYTAGGSASTEWRESIKRTR